jgi:HrpA-like RNA helicase
VVWDLHKHRNTAGGDVLVFMTGREDIERCLWEFSELLPKYVWFGPKHSKDPVNLTDVQPTG